MIYIHKHTHVGGVCKIDSKYYIRVACTTPMIRLAVIEHDQSYENCKFICPVIDLAGFQLEFIIV